MTKSFSDFRYVDPFRRQSRSKSKVVKNREKFWTIFWPSQIFFGAAIVKIVPNLSPLPRVASTEKKSREDTPTSPEVIKSNRLNFRPDF